MNWFTQLVPKAYAAVAITPAGNAEPASSADPTLLVEHATQNIINLLFLLGGILAILYLLWSGVQYISAGSSPDRVKAARQGIVNAVIGIIIMMAAFAIIRFAASIGTTASSLDHANAIPDQSGPVDNGNQSHSSSTTGSSSTSTTGSSSASTTASQSTSSSILGGAVISTNQSATAGGVINSN